jgi:hypothetical protein
MPIKATLYSPRSAINEWNKVNLRQLKLARSSVSVGDLSVMGF